MQTKKSNVFHESTFFQLCNVKLLNLNDFFQHSRSRENSDERRSTRERSSDRHSSDSSDSSSGEDDDDDDNSDDNSDDNNDYNKNSNASSNEDVSDYNDASPLSVERLAKSDHSDGGSPGHVDINGTTKSSEEKEEKKPEPQLPPYLPAIQGGVPILGYAMAFMNFMDLLFFRL